MKKLVPEDWDDLAAEAAAARGLIFGVVCYAVLLFWVEPILAVGIAVALGIAVQFHQQPRIRKIIERLRTSKFDD